MYGDGFKYATARYAFNKLPLNSASRRLDTTLEDIPFLDVMLCLLTTASNSSFVNSEVNSVLRMPLLEHPPLYHLQRDQQEFSVRAQALL